MDTFLWGHLKNVVYQRPNRSLEDIQQKIINEINRLNQDQNIVRDSSERLKKGHRSCFENNGGQSYNYIIGFKVIKLVYSFFIKVQKK